MNSDDRTMQQIKEESRWTQEELEQLAKAQADDVTTWPQRMQQRRERELSYRLWDERGVQGLKELRYVILEEALKARTANTAMFISEALEAARSAVGKDSLAWKILFNLDSEAPYGLLGEATEACLDLVPRLNRVLPLSEQDVMDAMLKDA